MLPTLFKFFVFFHPGVGADRRAHEQTSCVYIWGAGVTTPTILAVQGYDQLISSVSVGRTRKLGLTTNGRVVAWEVCKSLLFGCFD